MKNKYTYYYDYLLALILIVSDIVSLLISFYISVYIRSELLSNYLPTFNVDEISKYYWIILISVFMFISQKIYIMRFDFWIDLKRLYIALFYTFLMVFTFLTLGKINFEYSRMFIIIFFMIAFLVTPITKRYTKYYIFRLPFFIKSVTVVANKEQSEVIKFEIHNNWYLGLMAKQKHYDMVIISSKSFEPQKLQQIIQNYSNYTKDIYIIPYMDHLDFSHANIVDYSNIRLSAIHLENKLLNPKNILFKNIFEKIIVIAIIPIVLILHLAIVILIKIDSNGSAIFRQKRLGKNGKEFSCYKYRTMYEDGDNILSNYLDEHPEEKQHYYKYHKYKNDPRITKVGNFLRKTSLDEFPQFYNILRGDMNLIGPRPYMINEKIKLGELSEKVILRVNPGITGLWQVSGRNQLTFSQRVELDNWYIQNWSLWIDFVIFSKTIVVVLGRKGSY